MGIRSREVKGSSRVMAEEDGSSFESSFASFPAYCRAVRRTPERVWKRAGVASTPEAELQEGKASPGSGAALRRRLEWYDVVGMGVGGMVGAGIFVTTGSVASKTAGPAVIISYLVAGVTALASAFCYTEFAMELPVAGGAFSYLRVTFGEFAAYFTGANLIMEYVLSNAAVARTFLPYLVSVFSTDSADSWRLTASGLGRGFNHLDFWALALVLVITAVLCYSTKHTALCNLVVTVVHLVIIVFIIVVGFAKGDVANFVTPGDSNDPGGFSPYGVHGIFNGAAIVYFSYIGYDAVFTMGEEVKNPTKTLPLSVSGSVVIVTVLYTFMAAAICLLRPYDEIDKNAPFANAFKHLRGWEWASSFVGIGASMGILTSIIVAMLGQARYLCAIGRSHIVPHWFAVVSPKTGTPVNATVFLGVWTGVISLFTDLDVLLGMVSIGTLFVFYMVANGLIFHRHVGQSKGSLWYTLVFLGILSASALSFVLVWKYAPNCWWGLMLFGGVATVMTLTFCCYVPAVDQPKEWELPFVPIIASFSIFLNAFLLGSLDGPAYKRFAIWSAIAVLYYLLYGVHATHDAETTGNSVHFVRLDDIGTEAGLDIEMENKLP